MKMTLSRLLPIGLLCTSGILQADEKELRHTTSVALGQEFTANPYAHPNIPNVAFAGYGYGYGETPLPDPAVFADVKREGAKGDGRTDDTAAF
jgi:hypothetical protein